MDMQPIFFLVLLNLAVEMIRADKDSCGKAAKAESYLDTAADMISKIKETLPKDTDVCRCPPKPMDCEEILKCGHSKSGVYKVWPRNRIIRDSVPVYCDMETDNGGWTVIQRRGDFKHSEDFFNRKWKDYKNGFGDPTRDFWLGNDIIYALSNQQRYYLRIDLEDFENNTRYAFYDSFWIDSEDLNYRLHVRDYSGDAGDALTSTHNGQMFSTADRDNDNSPHQNCASQSRGGWWYHSCFQCNLNGPYLQSGNNIGTEGVLWNTWKNGESLSFSEMKLRPSAYRQDLDLGVEPK